MPRESRFDASAERLKELDEINRTVNHAIAPATDLEVYGVNEYWTLPKARGDCEDYALLKRHDLIGKGWPVSAMLMTVVRDEKGEGHAVLTARTVQGDYILDNKIEEVRVWNATPLPVRDAAVVSEPRGVGCARYPAGPAGDGPLGPRANQQRIGCIRRRLTPAVSCPPQTVSSL